MANERNHESEPEKELLNDLIQEDGRAGSAAESGVSGLAVESDVSGSDGESGVSGLAVESDVSGSDGESDVSGSDGESDMAASAGPVVTVDEGTRSEPALPFPVIGIGGSAGGVEAYIDLFQHLDHETGMAFVVIPHLQPDQASYLPEILSRYTRMQTDIIESGAQPEPDRVFLLPPNACASLQDGSFHLETRGDGPFHPIDTFFRSLAAEQKNLAVGVVLSGMDSDGAMGLKSIKGEGGISIVQAPESARFPEMPRSSIAGDHVDMVLPPNQIGVHLGDLAKQFQSLQLRSLEKGKPLEDEEQHFARILRLLRGVSGVDFRLYKPTTLRRRMARRMLMLRVNTLADYASMLLTNSRELRDLQEDILISITRFFRDPEVFEALKRVVFPQIFADRPVDRQVRMWVAGCSSGEEAYSIAICLLEFLGGSTSEPPIQIFGTDASEISIQRARLGIYPDTITAEVSPERLRRFFSKTEKGYQISKRIRDLCIFARQNLCNDPPFSRLDLISCRNVLIYFGSQLQRQLIPVFEYALRPEGFLLLGISETIREFAEVFSLADRHHKIYAKIGATAPRNLLDGGSRMLLPDLKPEAASIAPAGPWTDLDLQRIADRIVLSRYGPPGFVVNTQLEILQSRGHTTPFLELAQGAASLQLGRMLRESIAPQVTAAVKRAIEEDLPVQVEHLQTHEGETFREATLEVLPMHSMGPRSKCYLVLFVPPVVHPSVDASATTEFLLPEIHEESDRDSLMAHLRHDLSSTRLYLQSLLEERDARNQELISANEEIQSANEELQSTNEELETTKEELQSSNEELTTVNDELQNRNTALTQTSNDLSNLLNSVNLPVLMLSNELNIRHFTPQTQRLMNLRSSDVGRPFGDIRLNLNIEDLEAVFADVLDTLGSRELEVQDRQGHWYLLRARPYRTTDNKIDGVVVVLVDIDQLRRSQQELRDARDFAQRIIESIPLPLAVVDSAFRIRSTNDAFCELVGSQGPALEGRLLPDLAATLWGSAEPLRSSLESLRNRNGNGKNFEFEYRTPDQNPKSYCVRGELLKPDGEQFLLVTFEDMTAHKKIESLLKAEGVRLATEVEATTKELDRNREELGALTGNLLTSQEEERRRLARELHDDIGQRLAAVAIDGDQALKVIAEDPAGAREKLEKILAQVEQLSSDVRILSHGLHPSIIEDLGLSAALRSLTEEFGEREEMIATFFAQDVPAKLPPEIATGLYRIAQEALRNVAKHAGKTHLKVELTGSPDAIDLQISDSGKGFDVEHNQPGLGLISMKERARLMGATLHVRSAPREGTRVHVHVPLSPATQG